VRQTDIQTEEQLVKPRTAKTLGHWVTLLFGWELLLRRIWLSEWRIDRWNYFSNRNWF